MREDYDDFEESHEPAHAPSVRTASVGVPTPLLQAATTAKNASPDQSFQFTPAQPPPQFDVCIDVFHIYFFILIVSK